MDNILYIIKPDGMQIENAYLVKEDFAASLIEQNNIVIWEIKGVSVVFFVPRKLNYFQKEFIKMRFPFKENVNYKAFILDEAGAFKTIYHDNSLKTYEEIFKIIGDIEVKIEKDVVRL